MQFQRSTNAPDEPKCRSRHETLEDIVIISTILHFRVLPPLPPPPPRADDVTPGELLGPIFYLFFHHTPTQAEVS